MLKLNRRSILKSTTMTLAATSLPKFSLAQTASYTPDDLKGVLTPFGAIKAGNADGTIPAWTGGYSTVPPGYQQGDVRPIPFADEKPLFTITSSNYTQYQDKLPAGAVGLFQKYPDYRMDIYPTHRTAIAPQYVYDYIYKNATSSQLSADGNSVTNCYGGIPFPIPTNGHEVMWNHLLTWNGTTAHFWADAYFVTADGGLVFESRAEVWFQWPYYYPNGEDRFKGFSLQQFIVPTAPPFEAGASIIELAPVNLQQNPIEAWEYLKGERRVRRAPELQYDTPNSLAGGVTNWDEANIFSGKLNEYDFNYTGVKEIYIPYNCNKAWAATAQEQFGPHFFNPDLLRWELHRVRVVEMTLRADSRNVDARRTFYADEDTGAGVACDVYDASGALWKFIHNLNVILPDVPCVMSDSSFITYDLHAGDYSGGDIPNAQTQPQWQIVAELPDNYFTPGRLAAASGGY